MPAKLISLSCDSTCTADERAEIPQIEAALNRTLTSECFHSYFYTPGRRFDMTNGWSMDTIQGKLHQPTALTVNYFYKGWPSREEGYEDSSDYSTIHFNRRFTSAWSICEIASLGGHEFSHTKQFYHNGNAAPPNYYTIPYQINNAFEGNDNMAACCVEGLKLSRDSKRGTGHPRRVMELRLRKKAS